MAQGYYGDPWNPKPTKQVFTGNPTDINPITGRPYFVGPSVNQSGTGSSGGSSSSSSGGGGAASGGVGADTIYSDMMRQSDQMANWAQKPITVADLGLPTTLPTPMSLADLVATNVDFPTMTYGIQSTPFTPTLGQMLANATNGTAATGGAAQQQTPSQMQIDTGITADYRPYAPSLGAMPNVSGVSSIAQSAANPYAMQMAGTQNLANVGSYYQQYAPLMNSLQETQSQTGLDWANLATYLQHLQNMNSLTQDNSWLQLLSSLGAV